MLKKMILPSLVLTALCLSSCALLPKEEQPLSPPVLHKYDPMQYNTYTVTSGDIQKLVSISVSYVHAVTEKLSFPVGGFPVTAVNVGRGDSVRKGDVLATLDSTDLDGPLLDIQNQIAANNTAIENCKALYQIDKKIAALSDTSKQAASDYSTRLSDLEFDRQSLALRLQLQEKEEAQRVIKAGIDGVVSYADTIKPGDMYTQNTTVFTVDGGSASVFAARDSNAHYLTPGMEVDITISGMNNDTYRAKVEDSDTLGITEPEKGAAYLALEEPVTLPDNSYGYVKLISDERGNVLYVPSRAVNTVADRTFVYLMADNIKTIRDVTIGLDTGTYTEITGGLSEGDVIIVGNNS